MEKKEAIPILIPFEPEDFWAQMRLIIREEVKESQKDRPSPGALMDTPGLIEKPLYKIQEICSIFKISKPTIYDWIKNGKLKRIKIRSRVYFLGSDIRMLMLPE